MRSRVRRVLRAALPALFVSLLLALSGPAFAAAPPAVLRVAQATSAEPSAAASAASADVTVPPTVPEETGPEPAGLPAALSPWSMFLHADVVVKSVMVGLAFASVVTWTVALVKGLILGGASRRARAAVRALGAAEGVGRAEETEGSWRRSGAVARLAAAARDEVERSAALPAEGIKERVALALQRVELRAARAMTSGTGALATIGSIAPFVGLFGTVWGIMDSFVGISRAHSSNLAVVAPGIAEALLATAVGLFAAIPAVVIYNIFARAMGSYRALLADASAEVLRHLSRDLDRGSARPLRATE